MKPFLHPILTCEEAAAFEGRILRETEDEWVAMNRAGQGLGHRIFRDFNEVGPIPQQARILLLIGKGHNGGDACLAADALLAMMPDAEIFIFALVDESEMRPLAHQAYDLIADRVKTADLDLVRELGFDICVDGLFGMQFSPPLRGNAAELLRGVNANPDITFRVAIDLPSGLGDPDAFRADVTYATGIAKSPIFDPAHAEAVGRVRYIDIGFFQGTDTEGADPALLTVDALLPLRAMRPARGDKRHHGHLFVLAGSRTMPGAMMMASQAAATAGVGLLTVFAPESVAGHLVGTLPEAMWVPFPETPDGGLALEGRPEIIQRADKARAIVMGPGMGREPETRQLLSEVLEALPVPAVLDADALYPEVVDTAVKRLQAGGPQAILTPHAGEFERIAGNQSAVDFSRETGLVLVLKGPITRIFHQGRTLYSPFGGPILARGGTGDLLAGMLGARLSIQGNDPFRAACEGVAWHGRAADEWARARGAVGVRTTGLLNFLPEGLLYE